MAQKRHRVNSRDPSHRRTVAAQQRARRKGGNVSGKLKTHVRGRDGRLHANPAAVTVNGRRTYPAGNRVTVFDWHDRPLKTTARQAARMISKGAIPNQVIA